MKKRLNIIFFSLCFLGSVIAEAYFIQTGAGNLFSIVALGAVVLITGYLWMDSIRSKLSESSKEIKNYIDQMYLEETGRWNERLTELQNLQKATYTATKKNTATLSEQLEELIDRMDSLEANNTKALQRLTDLQLKALEGQKKALSLEINHNKENTRQLMKAISETVNQTEAVELLGKIADRVEYNTQVLQQELQNMSATAQALPINNQYSKSSYMNNEPRVENLTETGWDVDAEVELDAKVSGWNSDTDSFLEDDKLDWNSSAEQDVTELINNWSTTTKEEVSSDWYSKALQEPTNDWALATEPEQSIESTDDNKEATVEAAELDNNWNSIDTELNKLIVGWDEEPVSEKTPVIIPSEEVVIIPEVVEILDASEAEETQNQNQEIKPLYDDPNKALSADEIAALFASFGQ
jgi:hypothetical protein